LPSLVLGNMLFDVAMHLARRNRRHRGVGGGGVRQSIAIARQCESSSSPPSMHPDPVTPCPPPITVRIPPAPPNPMPIPTSKLDSRNMDNHTNPVPLHCSPRGHASLPSQHQLKVRAAHIINCIITDSQMPIPPTKTPPLWGYAFAAQQLMQTQTLPYYSTKHFIGAVIGKTTGNVLEYWHLIKLEKTRKIWTTSSTNKLGQKGGVSVVDNLSGEASLARTTTWPQAISVRTDKQRYPATGTHALKPPGG
jgi:hypothetical protein